MHNYIYLFQIKVEDNKFEEELLLETENIWDLISKFENDIPNKGTNANLRMYFFLLKIKYSYKFSPLDSVSLSYFHA